MTQRILILGVTGMLGYALLRELSIVHGLDVFGTVRESTSGNDEAFAQFNSKLSTGIDARNVASVREVVERIHPDVVINCIGVIKQLPAATDPISTIAINSLFPHLLAEVCRTNDVRLIHVSTDCVFSGHRGGYSEVDIPDPPNSQVRVRHLPDKFHFSGRDK